MNQAVSQATPTPTPTPIVDYYQEEAFKNICEAEAKNFVDPRYQTPAWAKNIRGEYSTLIYRACTNNLNRNEGLFNEDGSNMDIASAIPAFFQKHPHIDYICPVGWREKILNVLKENFKKVSFDSRKTNLLAKPIQEDDSQQPIPHTPINPLQSTSQIIGEVSSKIWGCWRIMSDVLSMQLVDKLNAGEIDEGDFNSVVRARDAIKKLAADIDDLGLIFKKVKKEKKSDD